MGNATALIVSFFCCSHGNNRAQNERIRETITTMRNESLAGIRDFHCLFIGIEDASSAFAFLVMFV